MKAELWNVTFDTIEGRKFQLTVEADTELNAEEEAARILVGDGYRPTIARARRQE